MAQPSSKKGTTKPANTKSKSPYHEAADLLNKVWDSSSSDNKGTKNKSLKSLVYNKNGTLNVSTKTYAVVSKILQHPTELRACQAALPKSVHFKNPGLLRVLLYELLLSPRQCIQGGGALKRQLLQHETALRQALANTTTTTTSTASWTDTSSSNNLPRYLRVNTCLTTTAQVIRDLQDQHNIAVYADPHVPDLLVVPSSATSQILAGNLNRNHVILQDKSSCFPALCLLHDAPSSRHTAGDMLDACAAPGNKTSQLAAAYIRPQDGGGSRTKQRKTTLYALDRDKERCQILQERLAQLVPAAGSDLQIQVQHRDFLKTRPTDYPNVTCLLLDPSCSGSGIYTRQEQPPAPPNNNDNSDNSSDTTNRRRLEKLSNFQITCLKHAMSFPKVTRIVYSTCSIHTQENEAVIAACLSDADNDDWEIVAPPCLATWQRRGVMMEDEECTDAAATTTTIRATRRWLTREETNRLIRTHQDDHTNGFFVACLERKSVANKKTTTTTTTSNQCVFHNPNHTLGIPLYRGEFAAPTSTPTTTATTTTSKTLVQRQQPESATTTTTTTSSSSPAKKRKRSINKEYDGETNNNNKGKSDDTQQQQPPLSLARKRAKKLEWKRQQHQQKMQRVAQKGSSKPSGNKV